MSKPEEAIQPGAVHYIHIAADGRGEGSSQIAEQAEVCEASGLSLHVDQKVNVTPGIGCPASY